eukprot:803173-Rhodomonas_salina.2
MVTRLLSCSHQLWFLPPFEGGSLSLISINNSFACRGKPRSRTPAKAYVVWLPHMSKFVWETASDTAVAAAGMVAGSQDESQVAAAEEQPQVTTNNAGEPAVPGITRELSADFDSGRGH